MPRPNHRHPPTQEMKPPPLRPQLPPPAIRRRRYIPLAGISSTAFTPSSSAANVSTNSPFRPFLPAVRHSALSAVGRAKSPPATLLKRSYAVQNPSPLTLQVFNAVTKHQQRERAASNAEASRRVDYLRDEVATRLCERLLVPICDLFTVPMILVCDTHDFGALGEI